MTLLELTDKEINILEGWLLQRESAILEELGLLRSLHSKMKVNGEVNEREKTAQQKEEPSIKKTSQPADTEAGSWVEIIKAELAHFSSPVQSGEIVKRLLQKPSLSAKGKRYITKAVTSKLWLLQERGEVNKTRENGRYVYSLKT